MSVKVSEWKWFGNVGHFICGDYCRFHLTTKVGKYLISTVGQLWPERSSREINANILDNKWLSENVHLKGDNFDHAYMKRFGYEEIGYDRTFETMVFKTGKACNAKECGCKLPEIYGSERDFSAYQTAVEATKGHMKLCLKWSKK